MAVQVKMAATTKQEKNCPCHHLNGGPCLFNVVEDVSESHNLASDPTYTDVLHRLLDRFRFLSTTGSPMAGLSDNSQLETWDRKLQCQQIEEHACFEPYAPDVTWPHPSNKSPAALSAHGRIVR